MTITGYIHGDPSGRLNDDSTIVIEGSSYSIPERVEIGGRLAPHRIREALQNAGYQQATASNLRADIGDPDADGVREIRVVKA